MHESNCIADRLSYIDGIKGIASILVLFCHLSCTFIPGLYFAEHANTLFEKFWINSPFNVLTNGNAPVQVFFVLSGFLISRKVYANQKNMLLPIKEYTKLLKIVIPGVLLSYFLMVSGVMFHLNAAAKYPLLAFVKDYNQFTPSIKTALYDILYGTFIKRSKYVGPFWTMKYELLGSILVSAFALCFRGGINTILTNCLIFFLA